MKVLSKEKKTHYFYLSEIVGTFLMVFIGCLGEATAIFFFSSPTLIWKLMWWGFGYLVAFYVTRGISSVHLNSVVTFYRWKFSNFPVRRVPGYIVSQLMGSFLAAALVYVANYLFFMAVDPSHTATTAYIFFGQVHTSLNFQDAFFIEMVSTSLLVFLWQIVSDENNPFNIRRFKPIIFFLYIIVIGLWFYPLTMVIMNPTRDLGPRLFAYSIGYGTLAIPGTKGFEMVNYIIAPFVGGVIGGSFYDLVFKPFWHREKKA